MPIKYYTFRERYQSVTRKIKFILVRVCKMHKMTNYHLTNYHKMVNYHFHEYNQSNEIEIYFIYYTSE